MTFLSLKKQKYTIFVVKSYDTAFLSKHKCPVIIISMLWWGPNQPIVRCLIPIWVGLTSGATMAPPTGDGWLQLPEQGDLTIYTHTFLTQIQFTGCCSWVGQWVYPPSPEWQVWKWKRSCNCKQVNWIFLQRLLVLRGKTSRFCLRTQAGWMCSSRLMWLTK